jgi:ribosomal protein S13
MEPLEIVDTQNEAASGKKLNAAVAITVALLATFMGICKVKDDNICQAMQQAQANRVDHWAFYQARNVREEVAKSTVVQLRLTAVGRPAAEQAAYQDAIHQYEALVADQDKKKAEAKAQAEQDQKDYDNANFKDDQFDLSDTLLAIAISLLAVTALTQQLALYFAAMLPTAFGVLMGMAGLAGWNIHPNALIALLS